jgi:hypothetical protein
MFSVGIFVKFLDDLYLIDSRNFSGAVFLAPSDLQPKHVPSEILHNLQCVARLSVLLKLCFAVLRTLCYVASSMVVNTNARLDYLIITSSRMFAGLVAL